MLEKTAFIWPQLMVFGFIFGYAFFTVL